MMVQLTTYKAFTLLLTDDTWRHWQKFNGVCIFRHRVDVRYDMCLWKCVNKGEFNMWLVSASRETGETRDKRGGGGGVMVEAAMVQISRYSRRIMRQKNIYTWKDNNSSSSSSELSVGNICWKESQIQIQKKVKRHNANEKRWTRWRERIGKHMGNFSVCEAACGYLVDTTAAVVRGEEEKWQTEREKKR